MAEIGGNLWEYNVARVVVVDVTDDYRLMQPPLPTDCYPVLAEVWVPAYDIKDRLSGRDLVEGYLYDWHQTPAGENGIWYVGVVERDLVSTGERGV